jgi:uncharacterized membrane protein
VIQVTLYTKSNCHLCDQAREELRALENEFPHRLVEVDIESAPRLIEKYHDIIPVVQIGPYTLRAPFTDLDLRVTFGAARNGQPVTTTGEPIRRDVAVGLNRGVHTLARHWLAFLNFFVFLYVGLPFAAPVLMKIGADGAARVIYSVYSPLCHQLAFRSWFLFGEQAAYPRERAGTSLMTFGEATGLPEADLWGARQFVGNEQLGYKVAFCERDVAIYGGLLVAGLLFGLVRKRVKPVPLWSWILFGIVPIALDGGTQMLGELPLFSRFARESTPMLRTLTGALFGVLNVWLAYPYVEETMTETGALVSAKLDAAGERTEAQG